MKIDKTKHNFIDYQALKNHQKNDQNFYQQILIYC